MAGLSLAATGLVARRDGVVAGGICNAVGLSLAATGVPLLRGKGTKTRKVKKPKVSSP